MISTNHIAHGSDLAGSGTETAFTIVSESEETSDSEFCVLLWSSEENVAPSRGFSRGMTLSFGEISIGVEPVWSFSRTPCVGAT